MPSHRRLPSAALPSNAMSVAVSSARNCAYCARQGDSITVCTDRRQRFASCGISTPSYLRVRSCRVGCQPFGLKTEALLGAVDHRLRRTDPA
jgi:hypothetical protein